MARRVVVSSVSVYCDCTWTGTWPPGSGQKSTDAVVWIVVFSARCPVGVVRSSCRPRVMSTVTCDRSCWTCTCIEYAPDTWSEPDPAASGSFSLVVSSFGPSGTSRPSCPPTSLTIEAAVSAAGCEGMTTPRTEIARKADPMSSEPDAASRASACPKAGGSVTGPLTESPSWFSS